MKNKIEPGEGIRALCERTRKENTPYVFHRLTQKEWDDLFKLLEEQSKKPRLFTEYWNGACLKALNPEKYKDCDDHCTYIITHEYGKF